MLVKFKNKFKPVLNDTYDVFNFIVMHVWINTVYILFDKQALLVLLKVISKQIIFSVGHADCRSCAAAIQKINNE